MIRQIGAGDLFCEPADLVFSGAGRETAQRGCSLLMISSVRWGMGSPSWEVPAGSGRFSAAAFKVWVFCPRGGGVVVVNPLEDA